LPCRYCCGSLLKASAQQGIFKEIHINTSKKKRTTSLSTPLTHKVRTFPLSPSPLLLSHKPFFNFLSGYLVGFAQEKKTGISEIPSTNNNKEENGN